MDGIEICNLLTDIERSSNKDTKNIVGKPPKASVAQISFDVRYFENKTDVSALVKDVENLINSKYGTAVVLGSNDIDMTEEYDKLNTTEVCAFCDQEVYIAMNTISNCPSCGEAILPCSMCSDCTKKCPFIGSTPTS